MTIRTAFPALRPIAIAFTLAFPYHAYSATVGAELESRGNWYDPPVSLTVPTTGAAFSQSTQYASPSYTTTSTSLATADGTGHFGGSALADHDLYYDPGKASTTTKISFVDSVTNTTGSSQAANFAIHIDTLSFTLNTGWMGDNTASFAARIYVNGDTAPIWESTATLQSSRWNDTTDATMTLGGSTPLALTSAAPIDLGGARGWAYAYTLDTPYTANISLGQLGAGDSLSIRYEIDMHAETYAYGGFVSVNFNDPSSLSLGGGNGIMPTAGFVGALAAPVPEPSNLAMMAAGLALLGGVGARRTRKLRRS